MMATIEKESVKTPFGQSAAQTRAVQFKGRPGTLEVQLDEDAPLLTILAELKQLLEQNQKLLGNSPISLNFGERPVDQLQFKEIRRIIDRYGLRVAKLQVNPASVEAYLEGEFGLPVQLQMPALFREGKGQVDTPQATTQQAPVQAAPAQAAPAHAPTQVESNSIPPTHVEPKPPHEAQQTRPLASPVIHPGQGMTASYSSPVHHTEPQRPDHSRRVDTPQPMHVATPSNPGPLPDFETQPESQSGQPTRPGIVATGLPEDDGQRKLHKVLRTCRAGTFIDVDGDVVLLGDLNPGAEIRATGDIIVFGSLRGIAHAGSDGDSNAMIAAYDLSPTQLRIAGRIAIAPNDESRPRVKTPIEIAYLNPEKQIEVEACLAGKFPPVIRHLSL
jgi:septum site-determining protein MinC